MTTRIKAQRFSLLLGALLVASCDTGDGLVVPSGAIETGEHPFDHEEQIRDVFADGNQLPAALSTRMHACGKISYDALGQMLQSRGVNLANTADGSAGLLYQTGRLTLGAPTYEARSAEAQRSTTGGLTRLYDILVAAAPELIANLPAQAACKVDGVGARLFDDAGRCSADGISCLMGMPAGADVVSLCDDMLAQARTKNIAEPVARSLAVAAMASSVFLCD